MARSPRIYIISRGSRWSPEGKLHWDDCRYVAGYGQAYRITKEEVIKHLPLKLCQVCDKRVAFPPSVTAP